MNQTVIEKTEKDIEDINRVILVGTLESDPFIEYTPSKMAAITRFIIVTVETRMKSDNEMVDERIRHRVVMLGSNAKRCKDYLWAGSRVRIEGRSKTRFKEVRDRQKIFITEVIGDKMEIIR